METAVESAREGIKNVSEKIGKAAGAGMAVGATAIVDLAGYHPSPLIAVGAAYTGMKVGGLAGRALNAGLDRVAGGADPTGTNASGPTSNVLAQLHTVLRTLKLADDELTQAINSINQAQTRFQHTAIDTENRVLMMLPIRCGLISDLLTTGADQMRQAREIVRHYVIEVAEGT